SIFFETSIFSAVTLFMSVYSTYTIAAHQAAINFASLLYMVPLSVGMGLTIAVGYELGAKRYQDARDYGKLDRKSTRLNSSHVSFSLHDALPILSIFFETSIFSAVTLFMSVYSTYTIAAHQAAINFASLLYMVPLSVGMGLTIAVGYELGAKRYQDARDYGKLDRKSVV